MANKACVIPSVFAFIFGILFVGSLVTLIVLATHKDDSSSSSQPSPRPTPLPPVPPPAPGAPIIFPEYSAGVFSVTCDRYSRHCASEGPIEIRSFGLGKFCSDMYSHGSVMSHEWADGDNSSMSVCMDVSSHKNCFRRSVASSDYSFSTEYTQLMQKNVSCYYLAPDLKQILPGLNLCDFYVGVPVSNPEYTQAHTAEIILESGTNRPVMYTSKDFVSGHSTSIIYVNFTAGTPADDSCMAPWPDVFVYDLRNGEGDVSEEPTFATKELDENAKRIMNSMRQSSLTRHAMHLPIEDMPSFDQVHVRSSNAPVSRDDIPDSFNISEKWPDCAPIFEIITDQNPCGSCWAMSSSGVLADRTCITKNVKERLSPQYMVYCGVYSKGCHGTYPLNSWEQLINQGTVSESCVPFTAREGPCPSACKDGSNITDDKKFFAKELVAPWADANDTRVQAIQQEILDNGSVMGNYQVFSDFMQYAGGIYHRTKSATIVSGHAVRIVGWGSEDGVDYWIVANSWGYDWGENGYFRIRRGINECNIEDVVLAGVPK